MSTAYAQQRRLEAESRALQAGAAQLDKQAVGWIKAVDDFNQALKVSRFPNASNRPCAAVAAWGAFDD